MFGQGVVRQHQAAVELADHQQREAHQRRHRRHAPEIQHKIHHRQAEVERRERARDQRRVKVVPVLALDPLQDRRCPLRRFEEVVIRLGWIDIQLLDAPVLARVLVLDVVHSYNHDKVTAFRISDANSM